MVLLFNFEIMSGGFKKNIRIKAPDIVGTKISVENAQLLVSTGAPDFDSVIGMQSYAKLFTMLISCDNS